MARTPDLCVPLGEGVPGHVPIEIPSWVMLMLLVRNPKVTGHLVVRGWLDALGWPSTVAMAFCIVGMIVSLFLS